MYHQHESDDIINMLAEQIFQDELRPSIINPIRLHEMYDAYTILRNLSVDNGVLSCEIRKPFNSVGSISLNAPSLEFLNCKEFSNAVRLASNIEIYPLTNGSVMMTLTFHRITRPLDVE